MLQFPQNVTVDLNVELTNNVINSVHVNQYEHKSREINIYVKKDGIDYPIPNDLTVNIRIHKSNGYDIYKTIGKDIGAINENIITFSIDESMTIASGRQTCDIEFIDSNDNRLYSTKFYINVHKSALDDNNIKDNDDYSTVQSLARESKEYANLSKSYAVGTENEVRKNDSTDNSKYYKEQAEINTNIALESSEDAKSYANEASTSAGNASRDAQQAASSASQASESAMTAGDKAAQASDSAIEAESFAHGETDTRENEDIDNAKYYYEQAKSISESFSGSLRPMGTVTFANLPALSTATEGDMYNISDEFTTNANFKEGEGLVIPAGSNVYKTADKKWDILAGSPVTGIKGDAETTYRKGNVNITKANIGLGNVDNTADTEKSVKNAKYLEITNSNEIRFSGNNGNINNVHINYALPNGDSANTKLTEYYFNNGQRSTSSVTLHADNFTGNAASATKATQDGNGNVITSTYFPKTGGTLTGSSKDDTGYISARSKSGAWTSGMTLSNAAFSVSNQVNDTGYYPVLSAKTKSGNFWNIGTFQDIVGLYGFKAGRTANGSDWSISVDTNTGDLTTTGNININGRVTINNNWLATTGGSGWINDTYGGGIYMADTTWVRTYNNKGIYTGSGVIRTDNKFESYGLNAMTLNTPDGAKYFDVSYVGNNTMVYGIANGNGSYAVFSYGYRLESCTLSSNSSGYYLHCNTSLGNFGISMFTSDTKLKKNIQPSKITNVLDKIDKIEFIEFDWKDKNLGHTNLGISANQLETVIPDAVYNVDQLESDNEYDVLKNIDSNTIDVYCLKAIQELYSKTKELEKELKQLKK